MSYKKQDDGKVSSQSLSFIATFVLIAALRSIIGYITLWFFMPMWNWICGKKS